jgi:uncharacterized protein (DUF2235 family)
VSEASQPRRIAVCLDGTWNSDPPLPGVAPTNALQIARRIAGRGSDGVEQVVIYEPGVGSGWSHLAGYSGWGVGRIIRRAYLRLARVWRPGDEIYLFGISRGAYQALSVARWAGQGGLPDSGASEADVERSFGLYRDGEEDALRDLPARRPVLVRFLGCFDAVEALGLPIAGLRALTRPHVGAHPRQLPPNVQIARHALALDEVRGAFTPAIWTPPAAADQSVDQVWFLGSHADICGGFGNSAIADYTLQWMMGEAEAAGLAFDPDRRYEGLSPRPDAQPTRQFAGLHRLVPQAPRAPKSTWPETERLDSAAANWTPTLAQ